MKMTRHNGRSGKNGVCNPKHNDRRIDVGHSDHIDPERAKDNVCWDCYQGLSKVGADGQHEMGLAFAEIEKRFYFSQYSDFVDGQNARNEKNGHEDRNRTTEDLRMSKTSVKEQLEKSKSEVKEQEKKPPAKSKGKKKSEPEI